GLTLAIDAASFAISSFVLALIRRDLRAPAERSEASLIADIREGIVFIVHHPVLRPMILFWGLVSITLAPLVAALTVHVTRDMAQNATILGLVLTAYGIGTVLGALLTARTSRRTVAPVLLGGTLTTGLLLTVVSRTDQIPVLLGAALIAGSAQSVVLVTYLTARTHLSPDQLLGRAGCRRAPIAARTSCSVASAAPRGRSRSAFSRSACSSAGHSSTSRMDRRPSRRWVSSSAW